MNNIDVVITMGGVGSRFREKGYNVPKYMIEANGKTLFEWSMISLEGFRNNVNQYIFIALFDKTLDIYNFIQTQCDKLEINNYKIIVIDKPTDGQATTAMLAEKYWELNNSLLIYNIDTYVEAGEMKSSELKGDGFIPCFKAQGNHWSFVQLDDEGKVIDIQEKKRISDNCTIGAYYFKTCSLYKDLYNEYYENYNESKEKYVAPLYNQLLKQGGKIYISILPSNKVHVLGTPEELELFKK